MKILAVASAGGHWVQLQRMRIAWDGCEVTYVTTKKGYKPFVMEDAQSRDQITPKYYGIVDANRSQKVKLIWQLFQVIWILCRERPNVIISTGASLGFFAIKIGKILGSRTVWVDSIANAEEVSLSGQRLINSADVWLTQWEELSDPLDQRTNGKPSYRGSVL